MKYAHYDNKNGKIIGFYDDSLHQNIPEPNLKISEDEWRKSIKLGSNCINNGELEKLDLRKYDFIDGKFVLNEDKEAKIKELEAKALIDAKVQAVEDHIYASYPEKKQSQDEKWVSSFTTKLKAQGVKDLEMQIVAMVSSFFKGSSLSEVIDGVVAEQKPLFEKLVKVGVRTEWAEMCVVEGKSALAENREPVYPEFPTF